MKTCDLFTVEEDSHEINAATALTDLNDAIAPSQLGLLTIGTLIDAFSGDSFENFKFRSGINFIIEICVERQKEVFEQFRQLFEETEYHQFKFAEFRFNLIQDGVYEADMESHCTELSKVVSMLDKLIEKKGDFSSVAMKLKEKCLQELEKFKSNNSTEVSSNKGEN